MKGIQTFGFKGGTFSTNKRALRAFVETAKARSAKHEPEAAVRT
jgi:hypothetical protein